MPNAKLRTSLIVPSVQELIKQPITKVPEQYLHLNQDPVFASDTSSLPQVPIIDLSKLLSEDVTELEKLNQACKEWGFFQCDHPLNLHPPSPSIQREIRFLLSSSTWLTPLINHGINPSLVESIKRDVPEFFSLPMENKKQFWQTKEDVEGFGQLFVVSEEQKLEWADLFLIRTLPLNTRSPRLFPSLPQPLRDNIENYSLEVKKLCLTIIEHMEKALKIESNEVLELFQDLGQSMRWNYYPPCPQPENVIGLNPHSDPGVLTILLQVNEIEGLQIKKDGKWIPIKPLSNAFVVNVGDTLEILTNGIYPSIEHRATVNSEKERISIATFHRLHLNKIIGPTPSLVTSQRPALFKRITVEDYYKTFYSRELQGKSLLDSIRI